MVATKGQMKERKNSGGVNNSLIGHYHIFKELESSDEFLITIFPMMTNVRHRLECNHSHPPLDRSIG